MILFCTFYKQLFWLFCCFPNVWGLSTSYTNYCLAVLTQQCTYPEHIPIQSTYISFKPLTSEYLAVLTQQSMYPENIPVHSSATLALKFTLPWMEVLWSRMIHIRSSKTGRDRKCRGTSDTHTQCTFLCSQIILHVVLQIYSFVLPWTKQIKNKPSNVCIT